MRGAYSGPGSRLWDKRAPLMHRPFAGPGPRLWDRGEAPSMQQVGPVNGTELGGLVCEGWIGAEAPNMGWNCGGWVYKGFPGPLPLGE